MDDGTRNVAVKLPAEDVLIAAGVVARVVPFIASVTVELVGKLVPLTVTSVLTGPETGERVIAAVAVTVNWVTAESDPLVAPIVWLPPSDDGIAKAAVKPPVWPVVIVEGDVDVIGLLSNVRSIPALAANPVPVAVT